MKTNKLRETVARAIRENWNVCDVYAAFPKEDPDVIAQVIEEEIDKAAAWSIYMEDTAQGNL